MADEEIVYSVKVEAEGGEKSLKQLRDEFKSLDTQLGNAKKGSKEFNDSLIALGKTKNEISELKDTITALNPEAKFAAIAKIGSTVASGFAAATAGAALFGTGSEDLQKTLVKVQAATALASGIQGLSGMADALKNAGLAMRAFALSNPFTAIAVAVVALTAVIYELWQSFDDTKDKADALRLSNETLELSTKNLKDETALATREMAALGRSEKDIFDFRQRRALIEIENVKEQIENINKLQRLGEITNEDLKKRNELEDRLSVLNKTRKIEGLEFQQKMDAEGLKITEEALDKAEALQDKADAKEIARKEKLKNELEAKIKHSNDRIAALDKQLLDQQEKDLKESLQRQKDELDAHFTESKRQRDKAAADEEIAKNKRERNEKTVADFKVMIQAQSFQQIGALALAFAGKSEASQKRAFEINKAAGIAQATIDTYISANKAYASQLIPGDPSSPIRAAVAAGFSIASGLARVAIIAKTKFTSSAPSGGGEGGGAPNLSNSSAPTIEPPQRTLNTTQVKTNEQGNFAGFGNRQDQRVYVVESDISKAQNKVSIIEQNAKY